MRVVMNIRIKRVIILALTLLNIAPQSTLCSYYVPAWAQRYVSQYAPSREAIYRTIDPRQYSPYTLVAGLTALGALGGGGLWYRNYLRKQEDLRKQQAALKAQAIITKKLELKNANQLLVIAENLDLNPEGKKSYVDQAERLVSNLITQLSPVQQGSQFVNTSQDLQTLTFDLKNLLKLQISAIASRLPQDFFYTEELNATLLKLEQEFVKYSLDDVVNLRNNVIKTILAYPEDTLYLVGHQLRHGLSQNYAEYKKQLEEYHNILDRLKNLPTQPQASNIFRQANHAIENTIKAIDTETEISQIIQWSSGVITNLYNSIDNNEYPKINIPDIVQQSDTLLESAKGHREKEEEKKNEVVSMSEKEGKKPIEKTVIASPPKELPRAPEQKATERVLDLDALLRQRKNQKPAPLSITITQQIEPQERAPSKKLRRKRIIDIQDKDKSVQIKPKEEEIITQQNIIDGIEQAIIAMETEKESLEAQKGFDFLRQEEIYALDKDIIKLLSYKNSNNLKNLIKEWLQKFELYQAIWDINFWIFVVID